MSWLIKSDPLWMVRIVEAAGLSRQVQHLFENQYGVISASRGEKTPQENAARGAELKELVRQSGYGYMSAQGFFRGAPEDSLLIPDASKEDLQVWAQKYEQESYIYGEAGQFWFVETQSGAMHGPNDAKERFHYMGSAKEDEIPDESAEYYTEIGGKRWRFRDPAELAQKAAYVMTSKKGKMWTLSEKLDVSKGQPYFFVIKADVKFVSPRYGFASFGEDKKLHMPEQWLEVFLPIPEA